MGAKCLLASLCLAVSGIGSGTAGAETLIINSYGGPYEDIIRERIIGPFEKRFGIEVVYDAVGSAQQDYAKIKATQGRPGFDLVVMTASQSLQGCKDGLLEQLTPSSIPNLNAIQGELAAVAGACGAVHEVQYLSLLYRTDKLASQPSSWSALLAPELNKRVILPTFQNIMAVYLLEMMSVTNGGDLIDNVDPGFDAMAKISAQSVGFEQSSAILESYLREGSVWAMPFWNGRAQLMVDEGLPVDYISPKEGTIPLVATLNIPVGAANKDAARKFIDFFLEKSSQEAWVAGYRVGSARGDITVPDELKDRQLTAGPDGDRLHLPDLLQLQEKLPEWAERWERDVVPNAR